MSGGTRVLGADVAQGRWVGVVLDGAGLTAHLAPSIGELVAAASAGGRLHVAALDIPIGLPDAGRRRADALARALVGRRASSVFTTPVRAALEQADHAAAAAVNRALAGEGVSRQAHGLREKVLEVDAWVRAPAPPGVRVVEVHPEVSFAALARAPLAHRKKTWAGAAERQDLLRRAGIAPGDDLGAAGAWAGVDDVLDAAVAAWTALRVARGEAVRHPDPPERFTDGWPAAIWA
jgi:predicted RNase H-like nuclease